MVKYRLELSNQTIHILERINKQEPRLYQRISHALDSLEQNPFQGKPLKGKLKGRYSYRLGSYRIIYTIKRQLLIVFVIDIGHRRDVYR